MAVVAKICILFGCVIALLPIGAIAFPRLEEVGMNMGSVLMRGLLSVVLIIGGYLIHVFLTKEDSGALPILFGCPLLIAGYTVWVHFASQTI